MIMKTIKAKRKTQKPETETYIDKGVYEFIMLYKELFDFTKPKYGLRLVWSNGKAIRHNK